jgi:hypothetical protein
MDDMSNCSTETLLITSICTYKNTTKVRRWIIWWWLFEQRLWKTSPRIATLLSWEMASLHHHLAKMELSHFLTRSILTHLEVSILVSPSFFYLMFCSILVFSVIYCGAFCLYFATDFFCIPVLCPKLGLYLLMCSLSLHTVMKRFSSQYPERWSVPLLPLALNSHSVYPHWNDQQNLGYSILPRLTTRVHHYWHFLLFSTTETWKRRKRT